MQNIINFIMIKPYQETISKAEEYFPEELVNKIFDSQNPIKAYREYRNLT